MKVSTSEYMTLYSWYSWPNVVLCFFGGFLIDRVFGIRLGAIIFAALVTVGQVSTRETCCILSTSKKLSIILRYSKDNCNKFRYNLSQKACVRSIHYLPLYFLKPTAMCLIHSNVSFFAVLFTSWCLHSERQLINFG